MKKITLLLIVSLFVIPLMYVYADDTNFYSKDGKVYPIDNIKNESRSFQESYVNEKIIKAYPKLQQSKKAKVNKGIDGETFAMTVAIILILSIAGYAILASRDIHRNDAKEPKKRNVITYKDAETSELNEVTLRGSSTEWVIWLIVSIFTCGFALPFWFLRWIYVAYSNHKVKDEAYLSTLSENEKVSVLRERAAKEQRMNAPSKNESGLFEKVTLGYLAYNVYSESKKRDQDREREKDRLFNERMDEKDRKRDEEEKERKRRDQEERNERDRRRHEENLQREKLAEERRLENERKFNEFAQRNRKK